MSTTTTTYARYSLPGAIVTEQSVQPVPSRDPQAAADSAPQGAFAFTFHDIVTVVIDGVELRSDPLRRSGRYFIGGTVHTYAEVAAMPSDESALLDNMRMNRHDRVIFCPAGNVQPFRDGDTVVPQAVQA